MLENKECEVLSTLEETVQQHLGIFLKLVKMLQNKVILVTGGTRGIGAGLVKRLIGRQDNTIIATGRGSHAEEPMVSSSSSKLEYLPLDVTSHESIEEFAYQIKQKYARVDVLINNAGIYGPRRSRILDFKPEDFSSTFQINAMGPFFVVQGLLKQRLLGKEAGKGGSSLIVNISTIVSSHGDTAISKGGGYAYRASKSALNIINKGMSIDLLPYEVYSTLIHPGYVATDMNEFKGDTTIDDSAHGIISHLESSSASELNGKFYSFKGQEIPW